MRYGAVASKDHDRCVRVVLLLPTTTYRASDFLAAARSLGVEVVIASDELSPTADTGGVAAVEVPFNDPERAAELLTSLDDRGAVDGIVAVDDQGVMIAAYAAEKLGLAHNPPDAAARTRDKRALRDALAAAEAPQPRYAETTHLGPLPAVGFPCVVKPAALSASQGVIRADDEATALAA